MAGNSYTVATGARGVQAKVLTATFVDTVTFTDHANQVEIVTDGTAAVYVTVDGSAPTVAGANTDVLISGSPCVRVVNVPSVDQPPIVQLISAGTPTYSVTEVI